MLEGSIFSGELYSFIHPLNNIYQTHVALLHEALISTGEFT